MEVVHVVRQGRARKAMVRNCFCSSVRPGAL